MNKRPKTITFYLPMEYSEELQRITDWKRENPSHWCRDRIIAMLKKSKKRSMVRNTIAK